MAASGDFADLCDALKGYGIRVPDGVSDIRSLALVVRAQSDEDNGGDDDGNMDLGAGETEEAPGAAPMLMSMSGPVRRKPLSEGQRAANWLTAPLRKK